VVDHIQAAGGEALAIRANVSREDEVEAMFAQMFEAWAASTFWSTTPASRRMRR